MDIQQSVHLILGHQEKIADLFYLVFLNKYPEVQQYFENVDMERQSLLLTIQLMVIERHYLHEYPTTTSYLKALGKQHQRRGIPADAFPKFRDALLASLQRFHGADWDDGLARQWAEAIDRAARAMLQGYPAS
jgi:hemoglobin-like flavoprotein